MKRTNIMNLLEKREENDKWPSSFLADPLIFYIDEFILPTKYKIKVKTKHPETGEILDSTVYSKKIRTSPNGKKLLEFVNIEEGKNISTVTRWIELDQNNNPLRVVDIDVDLVNGVRGHKNLPKSKKYGTPKEKPINKYNVDTEQETSKRILFSIIDKFFKTTIITMKLNTIAAPIIVGSSKYTEQTTNVTKYFNFKGPELNFELHSVYDFEDVRDLISEIIEFRYHVENNIPINTNLFGLPSKQVRQYAKHKWSTIQRLGVKDKFELTPVRGLHKKDVNKGDKVLGTVSKLNVATKLEGNTLRLTLKFISYNNIRSADTADYGRRGTFLFEPIVINKDITIPFDIENDKYLTVNKHKDIFGKLLIDGLNDLKNEIMEIDEDRALYVIDYDPTVVGK